MSTPVTEREVKNVYNVHVAGLPLRLRSSHTEDVVEELVQIVDQKVKEAMQTNSTASYQNALVLATLNMAEELLLLKKTLFAELDQIEVRARDVLDRFEIAVTEDSPRASQR